jgi:hypothetical protein
MAISVIETNSIANGAVAAVDLAVGAALSNLGTSQLARANMASGSVVQTVVTQISSVVTVSTPTTYAFYDIPSFTVTITPTSASNRILILSMISVSSSTSSGDRTYLRLLRNSTPIGIGDQVSNLQRVNAEFWNNDGTNVVNQNIQWLDSPATTSAVTYKFQCSTNASGGSSIFNRSRDTSLDQHQTQSTQIIALEIAA